MILRLKHFNIDEFAQDLPEILEDKIEESCKITSTGLFSEQIFGPIKSYKCGCTRSIYRGPHSDDEYCKVCNVEIISSEVRSQRYARVKIPFSIINPLIYMLVLKAKPSIKNIIYNMLYYKKAYLFIQNASDETELIEFDPNADDSSQKMQGADGVKKLILHYAETNNKPEFEFIKQNKDIILINNLIVMPPAFRNFSKNNSGTYVTDVLNKHYTILLKRIKRINEMSFDIKKDSEIFETYFKTIQIHSIAIYEYIMEKLSKKTGLIRGNILGKRVDFSGRAVISPDPTLNLNECRIPYLILLEMYKPKLITYLVNRKVVNRHNKASELIDKCIIENDRVLVPILEDFVKDKVCILNRQPTLHRLSVLAFKVKISSSNTIMIHPLVCSSYNADFDGDAMAIYVSMTDKCTEDINNKIGIWNNLISPTDGMIVPKPNQDIILGIYTATKNNTGKKFEFKNKKLTKSRYLFNKCLPENYPVIDEMVDKKVLMNILNDIALNYNSKECMRTLDAVKELGFSLSTKNGYTLSIDDIYVEEFEQFAKSITGTNIKENIYKLNNNKNIINKIKKKPYHIFIESGARGSLDQLNQLVVARGYVADANNKVRPYMINSSLSTGLNQRDFFESSWGTRKGLLDTALSTSSSGYLTRQLIYSTVNMELSDVEDCKTNEYLEIDVAVRNSNGSIDESNSDALAKTFIWRYIAAPDGKLMLITNENYKAIIGRHIKLRSPIYCKGKHICKKCYGNLSNILHSDQIGIIATHCIGELSTQLVLRTFHTSGVAKDSDENNNNSDIISGIGIVNKLFHKPSAVKGIETPLDLAMALNQVFSLYGKIMFVHYEVIISAMMWSDKKMWRTLENRNNYPFKFESILKIPSMGSWLLGISFSRLKNKLLDGLISGDADTPSSISKLFRY